MAEHPVEMVYKSLTSILSPYMNAQDCVQGICSCCKRPAVDFGNQGYHIKK